MSDNLPIVVVGAGAVGVMTAYALSKRGFHVIVVDALPGPAQHCSSANAGILAIGHAKAWAGPSALPAMMRAVLGRNPSVRVTKLADAALWKWGFEFLRNCSSVAHKDNTAKLQRLSSYSRDILLHAETEMALPKSVRANGGLYLFRDEAQFSAYAKALKRGGSSVEVLSRDALFLLEPGLVTMASKLIGGLYSASDAVADCRLFLERTAAYLKDSGKVRFGFGTQVDQFRVDGNRIRALRTVDGDIECQGVVFATGVETAKTTRPLGFRPTIYPVKGYSGTWRVTRPELVPRLPYVDETELIAVAVYGEKLRVTAMAEFAGHDRLISESDSARLTNYVTAAFGDAVELESAEFWSGLRPSTAAGPPFVGRVKKFENCWINAGHGQLGWTMSAGSGELLSQSIAQERLALRNVSARASWLEGL